MSHSPTRVCASITDAEVSDIRPLGQPLRPFLFFLLLEADLF